MANNNEKFGNFLSEFIKENKSAEKSWTEKRDVLRSIPCCATRNLQKLEWTLVDSKENPFVKGSFSYRGNFYNGPAIMVRDTRKETIELFRHKEEAVKQLKIYLNIRQLNNEIEGLETIWKLFSYGGRMVVIANKDKRGQDVPAFFKLYTARAEGDTNKEKFITDKVVVVKDANAQVEGMLFANDIEVLDVEDIKQMEIAKRGLEKFTQTGIAHLEKEELLELIQSKTEKAGFNEFFLSFLLKQAEVNEANIAELAENAANEYLYN